MRTPVAIVLICVSLMGLNGCGGVVFFAGTSLGVAHVVVISGTCTSVQIANVPGGNGGFIVITEVTFLNNGLFNTLNFCGDISNRFPLNQFMTVNFNNGPTCATPVSIVFV